MHSQPTILLVDDDPINRRVLASVLEGVADTTMAPTGAQALEFVRTRPLPDLIILDVMMPDMDGFAVCRTLKQDPSTRDIPIIFVTALNDAQSEEAGLTAGAVDYIHKPISRAIVRARVATHLELREHRAFLESVIQRRDESLRTSHRQVADLLESLRESEERFREFMNNAPSAMSLKDLKGRYLMVNGIGAARAGVEVSEMLGRTNQQIGRFGDGAVDAIVVEQEATVIATRAPSTVERTERQRDGCELTLRVTKFPVFDVRGEVVGVGTIDSDISDLKRAEQALRSSTRRFRDFAESSSDWFWELDASYRFTSVSERQSAALDDDLVARLNAQLAALREGNQTVGGAWRAAFDLVAAREPVRSIILPLRNAEGELRRMRVSGVPVLADDGTFQGYRGVGTDVTEAYTSQRQANFLRDAIDVATDAFVLYDERANVLFTNDAFHLHFPAAAKKSAIVGTPRDAMRELVAGTSHGPQSAAHGDADGVVEVSYAATGRTYLRRQGRVAGGGSLLQWTEITDRKRAERELQAHRAQLSKLASELSLAEERERRRIAAELHDGAVQNLGLLRIKTGALRGKVAEPTMAGELDELKDIIDSCNSEVRSLMSELSPPMLYELGLEPAVEWLADRFESLHGFRCTISVRGMLDTMDLDLAVMMFQTIRELLLNVSKHAQASHVAIELDASDGMLTVLVADNGVGFDVQRLGSDPTESGGYGLFNIRERLGLLGGGMHLDARDGTSVTLRVPMDPLRREAAGARPMA